MDQRPIQYADDDTTPVKRLVKLRLPTLLTGLAMGMILASLTSRFETVLAENVAVAFFIPVIVYLSDAVGTQTQTIFVRDLRSGRANFHIYLIKESLLGLAMGLAFGLVSFILILVWLNNVSLAIAVSLSLFIATASAPLISLTITEIFYRRRSDPAVTSGPIATVVQDTISIVIYGLISSAVIL